MTRATASTAQPPTCCHHGPIKSASDTLPPHGMVCAGHRTLSLLDLGSTKCFSFRPLISSVWYNGSSSTDIPGVLALPCAQGLVNVGSLFCSVHSLPLHAAPTVTVSSSVSPSSPTLSTVWSSFPYASSISLSIVTILFALACWSFCLLLSSL